MKKLKQEERYLRISLILASIILLCISCYAAEPQRSLSTNIALSADDNGNQLDGFVITVSTPLFTGNTLIVNTTGILTLDVVLDNQSSYTVWVDSFVRVSTFTANSGVGAQEGFPLLAGKSIPISGYMYLSIFGVADPAAGASGAKMGVIVNRRRQ